jgi:hypothetical protein
MEDVLQSIPTRSPRRSACSRRRKCSDRHGLDLHVYRTVVYCGLRPGDSGDSARVAFGRWPGFDDFRFNFFCCHWYPQNQHGVKGMELHEVNEEKTETGQQCDETYTLLDGP